VRAIAKQKNFRTTLSQMSNKPEYNCRQYREEMVLLGLRKRLSDPALTEDERQAIENEILCLEVQMGME
jgi:hypothetical protein